MADFGEPLVRIEGLSRRFDVSKPALQRLIEGKGKVYLQAVKDINLDIMRGETFALVGESGSGKSTVAKLIVGLLEPSRGRVLYDGVDMHGGRGGKGMASVRRRVQMIFQDPYASLNPRLRVGDIIAEPIRAFGLIKGGAEISRRVEELLSLVRLSPRDREKYPHEFSGGQRQRICIARALASEPEFLVCDEPTSALDVSVQAQVLNLMRDLQDELGLTYLFISHDLSVIRHMADRVGVMYLGSIVEVASKRSLFGAAEHPYTRLLLDAIPDLSRVGRARHRIEGEIPSPLNPPPGCTFHPRCPFANERCSREVPRLIPAAGDTLVACHGVEEGRLPPAGTLGTYAGAQDFIAAQKG